MGDSNTGVEKLHSACDECRTRKLKCSGEQPRCSRCEKEGIRCVYSPQKQMGRPRKRRREDAPDGANQPVEDPPSLPGPNNSNGSNGSSAGSFSAPPSFGSFGYISPQPDLSDFSNLPNFSSAENFGNGFVSQQDEPVLGNPYTQDSAPQLEFPMDSMIDPALWNATSITPHSEPSVTLTPDSQPNEAPCTCLSVMYLTLSELQSITDFSFPTVMLTMRNALITVSSVLSCERCPKDMFNIIQNVQTANQLFAALAERTHRIVAEIDREAERLERTGQKKMYRMGDHSPSLRHLHTGTLDCPMGFNIDLEAKQWKALSKKVLKQAVYGDGRNSLALVVLLDQMEARQRRWHKDDSNYEERVRMFGAHNMCSGKGDDAHCLRMIRQVRSMIEAINWD